MGVYIDMEMPTSCAKCKLFGEYGCPFIGAVGYALTRGERNEDCPLVPVPEHGDLIDRDKLEKDIDKYIGGEESRSRFHHWVQVQRSVIPKSEEAQT